MMEPLMLLSERSMEMEEVRMEKPGLAERTIMNIFTQKLPIITVSRMQKAIMLDRIICSLPVTGESRWLMPPQMTL